MARSSRRRKGQWKPQIKYADTEWDAVEKHDHLIDVLLTGRFPLRELQDYLGVRPEDWEKELAGKYGHVKGITYLIQMARANGWPIYVMHIDGESWVFLPQHVIDEETRQIREESLYYMEVLH